MSKRHPNEVMSMMVYPGHRRNGVASALHEHVERHLGLTIKPTWATTPEGEAFYRHREKAKGRAYETR
jgi:GNAT superfamily N-acetyltransferase